MRTVGAGARVSVTRSHFSHNNGAGLSASSPTSSAFLVVDYSATVANNTGVTTGTGVVTVELANTDVLFNVTAVTGAAGTIISFGNNRVTANGANGTALTLIDGLTNDHGQN